jgi:hypothetical protein
MKKKKSLTEEEYKKDSVNQPEKVENKKPTKGYNKTVKKKAVSTYSREVVDLETGELEKQTIIETQEDVDYNWEKTWIANLFMALKALGSKRVDVAMWLLENKNSDNQIVYTQREIAELTGVSIKTVNESIKLLVGCDAMRRKNQKGILMWNPDIIAKGNGTRRNKLVIEFGKLTPNVPDPKAQA